jgi:hypothetical protein
VTVRNPTVQTTMLCDLIDLLESPAAHVCIWRDGELYIEPVAVQR